MVLLMFFFWFHASHSILWKDGIADMGAIQFPLSMQAVPAFILGLYTANRKLDIHPWSIGLGAFSATVYVLGIYFGYMKGHADPMPIDAGMTGVALQLGAIFLFELMRRIAGVSKSSYASGNNVSSVASESVPVEEDGPSSLLLFPLRPDWDVPRLKRFGEHTLTPEIVWESMEGTFLFCVEALLTEYSWTPKLTNDLTC